MEMAGTCEIAKQCRVCQSKAFRGMHFYRRLGQGRAKSARQGRGSMARQGSHKGQGRACMTRQQCMHLHVPQGQEEDAILQPESA